MEDRSILEQIERDVAEEHDLWHRGDHGGLSAEDHRRLERLQVDLDRLWDLLRQRRARRRAGLDPDGARLRSEDTVEGFEQ